MLKVLVIGVLIFSSIFFLISNDSFNRKEASQTKDSGKRQEFNAVLPSLDQIFGKDHSITDKIPEDKKMVLIATGDVIPARTVNYKVLQNKNFKWPYIKTADVLKNSDITFINLEAPLMKSCRTTVDGMIFCGSAGNVEGLVHAGADVVNLANNHTGNYNLEGVRETVSLLRKNEIMVTGIEGVVIKNIKGIKFAFLGYNDITTPQPGISNAEEEKIKKEISEAKKIADVVIVTFHWGVEYRSQPDERQIYLGHFAIDSGADLVIGNHPHWIQPVEIYKEKLITYAHGNFIFDQEWSLKTKQGVVGKYIFYEDKLVDVQFLPVLIEEYGQPHFLEGKEKDTIINEMYKQSQILANLH